MTNRFVCNEAFKRGCTVLEEAPPVARDTRDGKADEKIGRVEIPQEAFLAVLKVNES